jgi:hypothetical protein
MRLTAATVGGPLSLLPRGAFPVSNECDASGAPQPRSKQGRGAGERQAVRACEGGRRRTGPKKNRIKHPANIARKSSTSPGGSRGATKLYRAVVPVVASQGAKPVRFGRTGGRTPQGILYKKSRPRSATPFQNRAQSHRAPYSIRRGEEVRATFFDCCCKADFECGR